MPELDYFEFLESVSEALDDRRLPLYASVELTERCNLQCAHCFISQPAGSESVQRRELATEQWLDILDQLADEGCFWLLVTGGEPLLRPDFRKIFSYAKSKGFLITLFTNGTLVTPSMADFLESWYSTMTEITLYGATRDTYETVTGVPGSYDRCMQGIRLLQERNIRFRLKTIVMTLNVHEFSAIQELCEDLGTEFRYDPIVRPRYSGEDGREPRNLRLSPEDVVSLEMSYSDTIAEDYRRITDKIWGPPRDSLYTCGAGFRSLHINAYGEMSLCLMSREPSYNLLSGSIKDGWSDFLFRLRSQGFSKDYACRHCELPAVCRRCPGFAIWENGDPETVVDYVCQVGHLRAKTFVPEKYALIGRKNEQESK